MIRLYARRPLTAVALVLALAAAAPPALAQQRASAAPAGAAWPQQRSDVPADEAARFGVLPNGMRYVIMRNETPPGAGSMRLRIDAGSLHEEEDQRGVAHFLEHLTLNETKNLPEGELLRTLERAGLEFGADTNAVTMFEQTVYKLDLPKTDAATVDTGLMLLREVASEATLRDVVVERERGIILSEERTRANPQMKVAVDELATSFPRDRLGNRLPIGTPEVIRTVTPKRIADFYRAYYRPERATLIAVGNFDPADLERKIRDRFASWKGQGPAGAQLPPLSTSGTDLRTRVLSEAGVPARVAMIWTTPGSAGPDTRARRAENIRRSLAQGILNKRLERLAAGADSPFIAGLSIQARLADRADMFQLLGIIQPDKWEPAVRTLEQEHRRLLEHGVTQAELAREINDTRARYTAAVTGASARNSATIAEGIVSSVNEDWVYSSPATELEIFEQAVAGLTSQQAVAAYRALASGDPVVHLASPQPVQGGEAALRTAFAAARGTPVAAPAVQQALTWPYESFGAPGQIAERRELKEIGATSVRFANGVRLTVKPTQFAKDEIRVAARFEGGRFALPANGVNASWSLPLQSFAAGGLGKLSADEVTDVLTGKVVGAGLGIEEDAFVLSGQTRPQDFGTQLQLLAAYATDPGFRPGAWERFRGFSGTLQDQYESSPGGIFSRDAQSLLRAGDPRWGIPTRDQMAAMPPSALSDMLKGPLASAPLEIVIVGDVTVDEAVKQVASTFGALPPRAAGGATNANLRFPAPGSVTRTHKGRADQALGLIAWPTAGFYADLRQSSGLDLLSRVVQLRLTEQLREAQGTSYSPQAGHSASDDVKTYGFLMALVEAPPATMPGFFRDAEAITKSLREQPISADELERARRPLLELMARNRSSSNAWWLNQLAGVHADPVRAANIGAAPKRVEEITPAELQKLARTFLVDNKAWKLSVMPLPGATAAPAAPAAPTATPPPAQ